jgi:hypothetical protein
MCKIDGATKPENVIFDVKLYADNIKLDTFESLSPTMYAESGRCDNASQQWSNHATLQNRGRVMDRRKKWNSDMNLFLTKGRVTCDKTQIQQEEGAHTSVGCY